MLAGSRRSISFGPTARTAGSGSTADCTKTLAIGSRASTASTVARSRSSSTRTGEALSTTGDLPGRSGDRHDGCTAVAGGRHLLGETKRLLDKGLDDLRLRHRL